LQSNSAQLIDSLLATLAKEWLKTESIRVSGLVAVRQ